MSLRKIVLIGFVSLLLATSSFAVTNISRNSSDSHRGTIAVNNQGVVLIVWAEGLAGEESGNLWYSYFKNGEWSAPRNTGLTRRTAWSPHLGTDSNGHFHLTWADGFTRLDREIYYAMFNGNTLNWGAWQEVHNSPENSAWQRTAVDGDTVYVAWFHEHVDPWVSDITSKYKTIGGSWPGAYERIGYHAYDESTHPALDVLNSRIHIVYMEGHGLYSPWRIRYKEGDAGRHWEGYEPSTLTESGYYPDMQVDAESDSHVVWGSREGRIYYRGQINDMWGGTKAISSGFCDLQFPAANYNNGFVGFCWTQHGSGGISVFYRILETGGAEAVLSKEDRWEEPKRVYLSAHAEYPQIWIDDFGYAHFMWDDTASAVGGVRDIFYEKVQVYTPPATMALSVSTLDYTVEGYNPDPETFTITNIGSDVFTYTAAANVSWITLSQTSGQLAEEEEDEITITIDANDLDQGDYIAAITFESPEAINSPQTITVNLKVLAPPIFAPESFAVESMTNRALFYVETVHKLTWEANPDNRDIVGYVVYNNDGINLIQMAELGANTFEYICRNIKPNQSYAYELAAVDIRGRIGPKATVNVGTAQAVELTHKAVEIK